MIELLLLTGFVISSGFFSGIETALFGLGPLNIVRGNQDRLANLYKNKTDMIAMALIGTNISIVAATIQLHILLKEYQDVWYRQVLGLGLEIVIFFILAEVLPKTVFRKLGFLSLEVLYIPIKICYFVFLPFQLSFLWLARNVFKAIPESELKREDLFYFLGANVNEEQSALTRNIMQLEKTNASEVMRPLSDLYMIERNSTLKEAVTLLRHTHYSRYPVYEDRGDNIIGYLDVDDILKSKFTEKVGNIMKPAQFFPYRLKATRLLLKMQDERVPMCFIVNEFGSVIGMVTQENLAEELVGEIATRQQRYQPQVETNEVGKIILDGSIDIDDFNERLEIRIKKEGFETIAGFLMDKTGRIPGVNEKIVTQYGIFHVLEADSKKIQRLEFEQKK